MLHCIYSLQGGGAERQLKLLVNTAYEAGLSSGIFCVDAKSNDIDEGKVKVYSCERSHKYDLNVFRILHYAITDFKPDVIHAWLPEVVTIPAQLSALWHRTPCVYSYRNRMYFHRLLTIIDYLFALFFSTRVVTNNPIAQSHFLYRWLFSIKNGVEISNAACIPAEFHKAASEHSRNSKQIVKILFVGRITHQKNWECLVKALTLLPTSLRWELTVCGAGDQYEQLLEMIGGYGLKDKIRCLGYCENIYEIMKNSDLMVLPSWYEGMPNVLLESLTIGLPCIVSDIPAHRYILGNTEGALTFNPALPSELARKIEYFIKDQTISNDLYYAGKAVAKRYTPDFMMGKYYDLYSNVAR